MNQYGKAALAAVEYVQNGKSPLDAWESAVSKFPSSSSKKACRRHAFLGLCQAGVIAGIPADNYGAPESNPNASYALGGLRILRSKPMLADEPPMKLWNELPRRPQNHNGQMDVLLALWNGEHISESPELR